MWTSFSQHPSQIPLRIISFSLTHRRRFPSVSSQAAPGGGGLQGILKSLGGMPALPAFQVVSSLNNQQAEMMVHHFAYSELPERKWLLPALGVCLLHLEHLITVLSPPTPLPHSLSGRQPTVPSERHRKQPRNAVTVWIQIPPPWTVIPGKGLQQISPVCTQDRQFEYFNCFPGGHDLFDLKRKGGRGNFFQAITTCYMCITTMYCAHIFQMYHTLKYLLDRTLSPVLPVQPTIRSSTTHPLRTHFPSAQCRFPKSGKSWWDKDGQMPNSSSHGSQDTLGIWLKGMSALQLPLISSLRKTFKIRSTVYPLTMKL